MDAYSDSMIGRILKNWVARHKPPTNERVRLLLEAAAIPHKKLNHSAIIPRPQFNDFPIHSTNEWSQTLCTWFFAQSIHAGVEARVGAYAL